MKNYSLTLKVEVQAIDMVEAGMVIGKALQFADTMEIIEFEEVN